MSRAVTETNVCTRGRRGRGHKGYTPPNKETPTHTIESDKLNAQGSGYSRPARRPT